MHVQAALGSALTRFWAGVASGVAAGFMAFRFRVFDPTDLAFHCLIIGALLAGTVTLVRLSRPGQALALAGAFAVLRLGAVPTEGWAMAMASVVIAAGVMLSAVIFDLLGRRGVVFGKFLILGPLVGGAYLAALPLSEFHTLTSTGFVRVALQYLFLGVVIGDGVGFGIEVCELVHWAVVRAKSEPKDDEEPREMEF